MQKERCYNGTLIQKFIPFGIALKFCKGEGGDRLQTLELYVITT